MFKSKFIAFILVLIIPVLLYSQVKQGNAEKEFNFQDYSSVGFNVSSISGIGLSFRRHFQNPFLIQATIGYISDGKSDFYSSGIELQYDISKRTDFRFYIAASVGLYGKSKKTYMTMGLGLGIEIPVFGGELIDNLHIGVNIFYPGGYFESSGTIVNIGGSAYLYYNF
jgi:hypothetical protein